MKGYRIRTGDGAGYYGFEDDYSNAKSLLTQCLQHDPKATIEPYEYESQSEKVFRLEKENADYHHMEKVIEGQQNQNIRLRKIIGDKDQQIATLKKALELACAEQAFRSCPCSEVDGCDTCPDEKQGDSEGATEEKRASCWKKYYIQQAQEQEGHDD